MFGSNKTLDGILAGFSKTLADLEAFSASSKEKAAAKAVEITQLEAEVDNHNQEAEKADKVHSNILALLG
jgi:hypothetical protein